MVSMLFKRPLKRIGTLDSVSNYYLGNAHECGYYSRAATIISRCGYCMRVATIWGVAAIRISTASNERKL